jgi:hypothetical protein
MVFKDISDNISVKSWRSVSSVEATGVPGEIKKTPPCHK